MSMPKTFQVIVSNVGTVYDGEDYDEALKTFHDYKAQSIANIGHAGSECVNMFENDEPVLDYIPPIKHMAF